MSTKKEPMHFAPPNPARPMTQLEKDTKALQAWFDEVDLGYCGDLDSASVIAQITWFAACRYARASDIKERAK